MGYGSYQASDWQKLKKSRNLGASNNASQTFTRKEISEKLNSRFIGIRESFDSEDSPNSTPVILGFDVTGSMGYLANEIATKSLNETITRIISEKVVDDPHLMCAAFTSETDPMQITQFEADIRVVEQLLDFVLGGGNRYSFDNLLWYFAAKHTQIDSFKKRGKKGILIGIGDEICGGESNFLCPAAIENVFKDTVSKDIQFYEAYEMASEQYEIAHIVIGPDYRFDEKNPRNSYKGWNEAIPGRVAKISSNNVDKLDDVIIAVMKLIKGETKDSILDSIKDSNTRKVVSYAIEDMHISSAKASKVVKRSEVKGAVDSGAAQGSDKAKSSGAAQGSDKTAGVTYTPLDGRKKTLREKINDLWSNRK